MHRNGAQHRIGRTLALIFLFAAVSVGQVSGQCILANPSFELGGPGSTVFGGWHQFGDFGDVTVATHGAKAARVSGPNYGGWDVSGYWQPLDSEPGEQWQATGHVQHPVDRPLTGTCHALVNIEWYNSSGEMIDYHSFSVADAGTPTDTYIEFDVVSDPAPEGTASIHFLLAVLQGPDDPSPDVYFDQVTIYSTGPPTIDELQWGDFPGGRTVDFAGRTWRVKGPGYYGPGPNVFCDEADCVWVDVEENLHLTLANRSGTWKSTEVVLEDALGYGDYILTTVGRLDLIDPQAVLGIFLWEYGPCWDPAYLWWNPYNEVDIEYSRWGNPQSDIGQFVAQPFDYPGNTNRFEALFAEGEVVSHAIRWLADRVEFRVWRGGPTEESPETMIHSWTYTGPHVPRPEQPRLHLNLWKLPDNQPGANQEVVFNDFNFVPEDVIADAGTPDWGHPSAPNGRLLLAQPSPFNAQTTIQFDLVREGLVDLGVFSFDGRRVRTLTKRFLEAGVHDVIWDGQDGGGRPVSSGIYWIRLEGVDFAETRRVALAK